MQSGPRRPLRDPERARDIREWQTLVVMQDQDRALIDRKSPQCAIELVTVGQPGGLVRFAVARPP